MMLSATTFLKKHSEQAILLVLLLALLLLCFSCRSKERGRQTDMVQTNIDLTTDTLPMLYAENLSLVQTDSYTIAYLRNPWDTTKILHTYLLVPKQNHPSKPSDKTELPQNMPSGTIIRVPVEKTLVYSSIHSYLMTMMQVENAIGGVCDLKYHLPFVQEACQSGRISDCGNGMNPDIEKVIELHPDLILLSPYENSGSYGRIAKLDIPILECADYMETSAMGRAEWIKFYGILFGCEEKADSIFHETEKQYLHWCEIAKQTTYRPKIFTGMRYGASWYVSGGKSTVGKLFKDAGLDYVFSDRQGRGADALNFESVFDKAGNADYWFISYHQANDKTYREIEQEYAPYAQFSAFKNRHIFGCNTAKIAYYEETAFRPDRLLRDLIFLSHPEISMDGQSSYFKSLAE